MGKARRKEKDSATGTAVGVGCSLSGTGSPGANDEGKLYLESALLERHLRETDLKRLVTMPVGLEENEWMASQTIALFEHVNLIYGTISEFCTSTTCPDMTGPGMRTYLWFDEKGKKVKVAAPQYVDYVMTFIQKTINDETVFPTKSANVFPSSFKPIVKKICRLMFHVIAHLYHSHFREVVLLSLHAHLNCVFAHFTIFNETFQLVEDKETEILQDLSLAMKLTTTSDPMEDDPMSDSNKENIITKQSTSQVPFTTDTDLHHHQHHHHLQQHHHQHHHSVTVSSSSSDCKSSSPPPPSSSTSSNDNTLAIKQTALVSNTSSES